MHMGAIAEAFVAFAQPLLDETDGSVEDMNRAMGLSQLCYNLALLPEPEREPFLASMKQEMKMDDDEFAEFQRGLIDPMIRRAQIMFPFTRGRAIPTVSEIADSPPPAGTDRYAPCPCNSGKKFKFCCGANKKLSAARAI
jgi:hypothetical protein